MLSGWHLNAGCFLGHVCVLEPCSLPVVNVTESRVSGRPLGHRWGGHGPEAQWAAPLGQQGHKSLHSTKCESVNSSDRTVGVRASSDLNYEALAIASLLFHTYWARKCKNSVFLISSFNISGLTFTGLTRKCCQNRRKTTSLKLKHD